MQRKRFGGYLVVGGLAFAIEYTAFVAIVSVFPVILLAQSVSFMLGLIVSFTGNRLYTFRDTQGQNAYKHRAGGQALRYLSLGIFNLVSTNIIIYWQVNVLLIDPLIAKVLTMAMVVVWNFIIFNKVIFKSQS